LLILIGGSLFQHCLAGWKGTKPSGTRTKDCKIGLSAELNALTKQVKQ